ncbi:MAG: hypothetical protein ABIL09_18945, partial [Gemmatimonadota bacterium]
PASRWFMYDYRQSAALKGLAGEPEVAARRTAEGYDLEVLVPWAPLGIAPEPGRVVAFQFYLNDRDEGRFQRLLFFPAENAHASSLPYRQLRLAEAAGPPVRLLEKLRLGASAGAPAHLEVQVRLPGPERQLELADGGTVLRRATADTTGPIKTLTFEVPLARLEKAADRLVLRQGGVTVAPVRIDAAVMAARPLLERGRQVAELVATGRLPAEKERVAAVLLAWTDLLEQTVVDQGGRDLTEVEKRAQSASVSARGLEEALAQYEAEGDPLAARRGGFLTGYISAVDGSGQLYTLYVPPQYDPQRAWPLHVHMHGYGGTYAGAAAPDPAPDHLMAYVDGRGQTGYSGLGERDVLEAIASVRRYYHIDGDRIYARGGSMGGRGTWSLTTRNPGLFAAALPDYGWADGLFLENLGNTPVWNFHDDTDWTVAVDHSRAAVRQLRAWGYPIVHTEATGGGHSTAEFRLQPEREAWLAAQVRDPHPRRVRHAAWSPYRGRAYWAEILELADPNLPGMVDVRAGRANEVYVTSRNVGVLAVDVDPALFRGDAPLWVYGRGDPVAVPPPLPARVYLQPENEDGIQASGEDPRPMRSYRPYIAGGLNYIWSSGEPVAIVRPTRGGNAALLEDRRQLCEFLSRETGSGYREQMPIGRIPVIDDVEVTDRMMAERNLVLVGPASANAALLRLTRELPVRERGDSLLVGEESL